MNKPTPQKLNIELPNNLEPIYANFALIAHTPSEIIFDLAQAMPNQPQIRVKARIAMTPFNAKLLLRALQENLVKYETTFGEIVIPGEMDDLARAFFGGGAKPPQAE